MDQTPYHRFVELVYEACHAAEAIDYFDLRDGDHMRTAWAWLLVEQQMAFRGLVEHIRDHADFILKEIGEPLPEPPIEPPSELLSHGDLLQARHDFLSRYAIKAEQAAIAADRKTDD